MRFIFALGKNRHCAIAVLHDLTAFVVQRGHKQTQKGDGVAKTKRDAKRKAANVMPMTQRVEIACQCMSKGMDKAQVREHLRRYYKGDDYLPTQMWAALCDGSYAKKRGPAAKLYASTYAAVPPEILKRSVSANAADAAAQHTAAVSTDDDIWRAIRALSAHVSMTATDVLCMLAARITV